MNPAPRPAGPAAVPLTGTDWFLLGIDRSMRRRTGSGCVCHLVVVLERPLARADVGSEWLAWLGSLRLVAMPPFVLPRWEARGDPALVREVEAEGPDDLIPGLVGRMDPLRDACVQLTTARLADGRGALVLSWHHALLDARTAEALVASLGAASAVPALVPATVTPLAERLRMARGARDFVWDVSVGGLASPGGWSRAGVSRHRHMMLSAEEAAVVRRRAEAMGVGLIPSSLHAGAASWAVADLLRRRGVAGDLLVPVPQERRSGAIARVGNGISLLFFRVPVASQGAVEGLAKQALEQVRRMARDRVPLLMSTLLDLCRWLPIWLYLLIVALPTRGRLASFGFSDTGDSLSRLTHVGGAEVVDAFHLPANVHPPGLTFVFSQFRGQLQVCVGWAEGVVAADEVDGLVASLREALLGS